jgi:hypothetical protein
VNKSNWTAQHTELVKIFKTLREEDIQATGQDSVNVRAIEERRKNSRPLDRMGKILAQDTEQLFAEI